MPDTRQLSEIIFGWPHAGPQTGTALLFVDDDELRDQGLSHEEMDLVRGVRRHVRVAAMERGQSAPLSSTEQVQRAVDSGDLHLVSGQWLTLVLDERRMRMFKNRDAGASRTVTRLSKRVPELHTLPQLPTNGIYLMLYGGGPDVLENEDVRQRLRELAAGAPVADVFFRETPRGGKFPTLYSMREGCGCCANERVEFPNPDLLEEVNLWH